jgi:Caspase domain
MLSRPLKPTIFAAAIAVFAATASDAAAQNFPRYLPHQYKRFFTHFTDTRSLPERMLNIAGLTSKEYGHGFALIAGVSNYPRMAGQDRILKPAAEDLRKLRSYLIEIEKFEEVVVLDNDDVSPENLYFFLVKYFPRRLKEFPGSRFLFAYSGHGFSENEKGYLLTSQAEHLEDTNNSIHMSTVRSYFQHDVESGFHVLAMINACHSGEFIKRPFGNEAKRLIPRNPGAHAITAGGSKERTWHDASVGSGSIFFEKFFAALDGRSGDGPIVTVDDLVAYLRREIRISTDQTQNPLSGDLSRDGSLGGMFFFNRRPLVERKELPNWNSAKGVPFGGYEAAAGVTAPCALDPNQSSCIGPAPGAATKRPPTASPAAPPPVAALPDRPRSCVDAQRKFRLVVSDLVRKLPKYAEYASGEMPKAVALCIDWTLSTPERRIGHGYGMATAAFATHQSPVNSKARSDCVNRKDRIDLGCTCEIVEINGRSNIKFPAGWPRDCN